MKLAAIFTDHMVLQRDCPIAIFGEGNGHGTATLNGATIEFEADGRFVAYLPEMKAGGPYELTVTMGDESVTFTDVLIGDVYLAGGQSNMQFRVEESTDIPRIGNPMVRHFTEGHFADENRVENYNYTPWQVATEENLEKFSAIGYDVGRMLCEKMDIPIGIISCNIGASRVDAWTAPEIVETAEYQQWLGNKHWDWHYYKFNQGSWCYLNKLLPIVPYTISGVLWYQGESNRLTEEAVNYDKLLSKLIANWRDLWQKDLPFYIVQIAPHADGEWNDWPHIRQAQERVTKEVSATYLCTLVHTGEADNIHPTKKHALAVQLTNSVLANAFGADLEYCGPVYDTVERTEAGIKITFTHAIGLHFDGDPADLSVFDAEGNAIPYTAAIQNDALYIIADGIARIELGWQNAPTHNLYNDSGCLASPFQIILGE